MKYLMEKKDFLKPFSEPDNAKFTVNLYKIKDKYTDERKMAHTDIIYVYLKDKAESEDKEAILLGGGAGAGKSTILKHYFLNSPDGEYNNFVHIDSDDIKNKIKEYKEYLSSEDYDTRVYAAFYVHRESTDIADKIIDECINKGLSFIYDGTMTYLPQYENLLNKLDRNAYTTIGLYVDVAVEVALHRVQVRALDEGRYVDLNYTEISNRNSAINFHHLMNKFTGIVMYNNTLSIDNIEGFKEFYRESYSEEEIINHREYRIYENKLKLGLLSEKDLGF